MDLVRQVFSDLHPKHAMQHVGGDALLVDHLGNALTHGGNDSTHKSMRQIIMSWSCSYSRKASQPASQPRYCPLSKGLLTPHWTWPEKQNRCTIANCQITGLVQQTRIPQQVASFEEAQSIQGTAKLSKGTLKKLQN
jgi:hypothetical protein